MKTNHPFRNRRAQRAFNLLELMVLMAVGMIVVLLILPGVMPRHRKAAVRINCVNNLKQVALAFRIWAGDNNDVYPMQAETNALGGPKYGDASNAFRYFQIMSNELSTPKIVICPADAKRFPATNFLGDFNNLRVSYFIGMEATETNAAMFLSGDSHLTNKNPKKNGMQPFTTNQPAWWTKERHQGNGNIAITDGSVAQLSSARLAPMFVATGRATNSLLFP